MLRPLLTISSFFSLLSLCSFSTCRLFFYFFSAFAGSHDPTATVWILIAILDIVYRVANRRTRNWDREKTPVARSVSLCKISIYSSSHFRWPSSFFDVFIYIVKMYGTESPHTRFCTSRRTLKFHGRSKYTSKFLKISRKPLPFLSLSFFLSVGLPESLEHLFVLDMFQDAHSTRSNSIKQSKFLSSLSLLAVDMFFRKNDLWDSYV